MGGIDGTAAVATFNHPQDLVVDPAGNVFVANTSNSTIRKISPAGMVSTVMGVAGGYMNLAGGSQAMLAFPTGIALDPTSGKLFITVQDAVLKSTLP